MKFKLDENFGAHVFRLFQAEGYDVQTVVSEGLQGTTDINLYTVCQLEGRCLVTLDLDFADVLRFPPLASSGIVVIRMARSSSRVLLEQLVQQFFTAAKRMDLNGKLWIVEPGRVRIHVTEDQA